MYGYSDTNEFYNKISINEGELERIDIPMLLMNSKDDPIVKINQVPLEEILRNRNLSMLMTEKGAHVCWFSGMKPRRWYVDAIMEYLKILEMECYLWLI